MPDTLKERFSPIFVVGVPRSGTTLLSSVLNRHSNISIPPETQFFTEYLPDDWRNTPVDDSAIDALLTHHRMSDLELDKKELINHMHTSAPCFPELLQGVLECYASKHGKKRAGEKSPNHLSYVPLILDWFPDAKIICIVRDGRDVSQSLMNAPWAHNSLIRHSLTWRDQMIFTQSLSRKYGKSLYILKYESLLLQPTSEIQGVCDFIEESFEEGMLDSSQSETVPGWELAWKQQAMSSIDASKVSRWNKECSSKDLLYMDCIMRDQLHRWGYEKTTLAASFFHRLVAQARILPFRRPFRDLFRIIKKSIGLRHFGTTPEYNVKKKEYESKS